MQRQAHAYPRVFVAGKQKSIATKVAKTTMQSADCRYQRLKTGAAADLERKQVVPLQSTIVIRLTGTIHGPKRKVLSQRKEWRSVLSPNPDLLATLGRLQQQLSPR